MTGTWLFCWILGLSLIGATIAFHVIGLVYLGVLLIRVRRHIKSGRHTRTRLIWVSILTLGYAGTAIAFLHAIEAGLWAVTYRLVDAVDTRWDAILYSIDSISTRGASGIVLPEEWRLLGALEAADGMLLFGISTAFLFTALQRVLPLLEVGFGIEDTR